MLTFNELAVWTCYRQNSNNIFEVLVPENHENWHKFYLFQLLFKSVNIYVKNVLKELYLCVYFHAYDRKKYVLIVLTDIFVFLFLT